VELRQLRAVEAVARLCHFTRAAEELHIAQSALSHQIRQLERELGTPLFERTSRRVRPTEAGTVIARRARHVTAELDGAVEEIDELRGLRRGRVRIGALLPAGDLDVPGILARFRHAYPGIQVGLHEGIAADMFDRLATGDLDAAFCLTAGDVPNQLAVRSLSQEEVIAAFAPRRAPRARSVAIADLAQRPIIAMRRGSAITRALEDRLTAAGHDLHLALESGDPFLLRSLAARDFATAILPRSITTLDGPPIEVRSLRPPLRLLVVLAWYPQRDISPAARAFVDFVLEAVANEPDATHARRAQPRAG
jgi:LysR family transcriptional regulator, transcription activator of glutamate synthase operon